MALTVFLIKGCSIYHKASEPSTNIAKHIAYSPSKKGSFDALHAIQALER